MASFEAWARAAFGVPPSVDPSHTTLTGGRLYVPAARFEEFMDEYERALQSGQRLHVVERHRHVGPVVVDLDFRGRLASAPDKLYAPEDVERFVRRLLLALPEVFALDALESVTCYVLEKPARVHACRELVKDGLHLIIPGFVSRPEAQLVLRKRLLRAVVMTFSRALAAAPEGSPSASAEGAYDVAVIERNGWMMYGSRKPDEERAWTLTRAFELDLKTEAVVECRELPEEAVLPRLFSIRCAFDRPEAEAHGEAKAEVDAIVEAREVERLSRRVVLTTTSDDHGPSEEDAIAWSRLLSPARAVAYETWSRVLFAMHNATGGSSAGLAAFSTFSARAEDVRPGAYDPEGCERQWRAYRPPPAGRERLGAGSLAL